MESPLSFFRMHWGHEPLAVPRWTESADKSDALQTLRAIRRRPAVAKRLECVRLQRRFPKAGCNSMAGRFMESLHDFDAAHWDHELQTSRIVPPTGCCRRLVGRAALGFLCRQDAGSTLPGSWRAPFRFFACIGAMNRWPCRAGRKAPINRTHSRRFARFGDARLSRSVWSACVLSAAFPRGAATRWPGRFMERTKSRARPSRRIFVPTLAKSLTSARSC